MSESAVVKEIRKERTNHWAWIWLGYTGFLFLQPIFHPNLRVWVGTITGFALFLLIFFAYVRAMDQGLKARFWMIGATFLLGLVIFPWNHGASTFFVYAAAFLPFTVDETKHVLWLFLLECVIIFAEGFVFTRGSAYGAFYVGWPDTLIAMFLVFVIGGGNIFFAAQRRAGCKLRAALEQNVALAAVAERERIARDLHDVLGHTLSLIVLKTELAGRLITIDPERAKAEIADVEKTSRSALAEVREAIGGYRSRGLAAEIDAARRTLDAAGIALTREDYGAELAALTSQEETALALALREAVTNIVRHARASNCTLRLTSEEGRRVLVVEDDGQQKLIREGNGLRGMRERVEAVGAQFCIESGGAHGWGTRLTIELPARQGEVS